MLQENSARKEDQQVLATPSLFSLPVTAAQLDLGTFSRAIEVEAPGYVERRAVHSVFSFTIHLVAVMAIVWFWPLAFPQRPYAFAMSRQFVSLPLSATAAPDHAVLSFGPAATGNPFRAMKLLAPVKKPNLNHAVPPPPEQRLESSPLTEAEALGSVLGAIMNETSRPAMVPALPLDIPQDARVFQAGGYIRPSRLIERVSFSYPALAKIAHVFGNVVIAAVIDETGKVTEARLVSGPEMLAVAAINDLTRERFQPTMLDGRPTKCDLTLRVTFHLAGWEDQGLPRQ